MRRSRGHLRFDRRFGALGVPRLQRSSGTSDARRFAALNELLTVVASSPEAGPIIQAFAAELISIEDLDVAATLAGRGILGDNCSKRLEERRVANLPKGDAPSSVDDAAAASISAADVLRDLLPARASIQDLIDKPFWSTVHDELIPSMDVKATTRLRYATSIRALRAKLAASAMYEDDYQLLAAISEEEWRTLEAFRTRGVSVPNLLNLAMLSRPARRQLLRTMRVRIGDELVDRLSGISTDQLRVLEREGFIVGANHFAALDRLDATQRDELRRMAAILGSGPLVKHFVPVTAEQWKLLATSWGASAADWNHVRRAMSAVLTTLFHGDVRNPIRQHIVDAMPLLHEELPLPDVSPATFWRIMDHFPEYARAFPISLVATGLRIGEYERLERSHLRPETCGVYVPGTKTKESAASISVAPELYDIVDHSVPSPFRYGRMRRLWREACEAAGVSGVTLHALRHCHGQWAVNEGASTEDVQAQLRHSNRAQTERYTRVREATRSANAAGRAVLTAKPRP